MAEFPSISPEYTHFVWKAALSYLDERAGGASVRAHMADPPAQQLRTLTAIYRVLVNSLRNRQAMFNTIGDLSRLEKILCQFEPIEVTSLYGDDWGRLLQAIKGKLRLSVDPTNSRGYWVHFVKGAVEGARFLTNYTTAAKFIAFVHDFYDKPTTRPALPMLLAHEIHGFGFALACDFLKEIGFNQYAKPDVHVIDLFHRLDFSRPIELDVYRAVCQFASRVQESPYAVDKAFWLIGSGNLYHEGRRFATNRNHFIAAVKKEWGKRQS